MKKCPECNAETLRYSGLGTQRVEDEIKLLFPNARVLRMDTDSTMSRSAYEDKFKAFSEFAQLNPWGYFDSAEDCCTRTPGLFVAGDCRSKRIRQVVTASGDGAVAAMAACRYLD